MAVARAILAVAAVAALAMAQLAAAADHKVGGDGAWDASGNSYDDWSKKQTFKPSDTISFTYSPSHDVMEVDKAGYDACSGSKPVKSYTGGATKVTLTAPGKRYFICGVPGHCAAGMKLEVTVAAAAVTAPAPGKSKPQHRRSVAPTPAPAVAPAAAPSTGESSPTAAPTPKASAAASVGMLGAKAVVGLAVGVALALAM